MHVDRIAELLAPYIKDLSPVQLGQLSAYLDLLIKWNARMNLTAVRDPEQMVVRHFGESLFLARNLPAGINGVTDVGSGAGFPGIPINIYRPLLTLTLIEAQQRKATFLREVLRTLKLQGEVKNIRAEDLLKSCAGTAELVTMRAVEKFEDILPVAAQLVCRSTADRPAGHLALLIGATQVKRVKEVLTLWQFHAQIPIPESESRVILMGNPGS